MTTNRWFGGRQAGMGIAAAAALAGIALAGCGEGDVEGAREAMPAGHGESLVTTAPPDEVIRVALQEWAVLPEAETAAAGVIQFSVDNRGTELHEFVLLKDGEALGEIEGIGQGRLENICFELKPGTYELACLIVETEPNGEVEDHYALGMHTEFTVR